ncbi:MAG: hypothetical protein H0Z19_10180 [Archaeoglobus sp.]|nr:hypothetical protein [Archaeoglobus sp.]
MRVAGRYRLVYKVSDSEREVILVAFGHRKRVYDLLTTIEGK